MTIMTLEVKSAAKVDGHYGPQWELSVLYPFSKYPAKAWIDRDEGTELVPGSYKCEVRRDKLREGKEGAYDYNWNWKIDTFNVEGKDEYKPSAPTDNAKAEVSTQGPVPNPWRQPSIEEARIIAEMVKRHSIHRQVALKAAVALLETKDSNPADCIEWAEVLFAWLQEQPTQAPSKADSEPEPVRTGRFDKAPDAGEELGMEEQATLSDTELFNEDRDDQQRQFRDMKELKAALTKDFGIPATQAGKSQVNAMLFTASGDPALTLDTADGLPWVYETVKAAKKGAPTQ